MLAPLPLLPSATIAVVAPSGPFDAEELERGLARLSPFQLRVPRDLAARRQGYLAGTDQQRRSELQAALDDPGLDAILIARGGFGLGRIIDQLDFTAFHRHPKWVVGFSDATVLHARLWNMGFRSLHAPNGTTLSRSTQHDCAALIRALCGDDHPQFELLGVRPGSVTGTLVGGNLTVLFTEAAAGRLHFPPQSLLFIEDVTETSYRVDRMLHALCSGGYLEPVAGLIVGDFTDCSPGKFGVEVNSVLLEFAERLGIPVATGLPVGHGVRNYPLTLTSPAKLDVTSTRATLSLDPSIER